MPDKPASPAAPYLGIDVAKDWIDIARAGCKVTQRVANTEAAIQAWLQAPSQQPITLVAFEPTGSYERTLCRCLVEAGIAFARVRPQ